MDRARPPLLKLIAGDATPDQGTIKRADPLAIVYFDQHRFNFHDITLRKALCPHGDYVLSADSLFM
jgi:ATPase subunit of ABC transporter with duplicated ATPase domains